MKVLVTGGAGYIGSHCCKRLRQIGYQPVVIDSLVNGHEEFVRWGELVKGEVGDDALLDRLFGSHDFSAVVHFAAFAYVGESVADPAKYYHNNLCGTLHLLDAMRRHGVRDMIFSSTCATYGDPVRVPMSEDHPQNPINAYGRSKLMIEQVLADYERAYGIRHVSLRYFNAAGADPDGEVGERHAPETHLIPLILSAAAGELPKVDIFGNDYPTPDGTCIRDYIHVTDLAEAHAKAIDYLKKGGGSQAFNLGTGKGYSVMEVIKAVEVVTGKQVPFAFRSRRAGDPAELVAANTLACETLQWQPLHSDLHTIIETAWQWHRKGSRA